jgi:hypothetical protein
VKCPECKAENAENVKFFGYCGSSIQAGIGFSERSNNARKISEDPPAGLILITQSGIYWAEFSREQGKVLYVVTPLRVSALQA